MYAVYFNDGRNTYRLPTNPEEIEVSSTQAISKYEVLKLGQVAVPTHMELKQYSFECEFPLSRYNYVNADSLEHLDFHPAGFYIDLFSKWRNQFIPVRFLAGREIADDKLYEDSISTMVLIEDITVKEKAGEEGDKYISFKLLEYRDFIIVKSQDAGTQNVKTKKEETNPKSKGSYVVQSGDSLWAIAKKYYGDGSKYTKIYNANKDKIKNPSLIYPGQKLVIP